MRSLLLAACLVAAWTGPSVAQVATPAAALIPRAATGIPGSATPSGAAGSAATYVPSDAVPASGTRSARVTTAADGTFSMTWSVALISPMPVAVVVPLVPSGNPIVCNVATVAPAMVAGKCWQLTAITPTVLGASLSPFTTTAAGVTVMVLAREPSP